MSWNVTKCIELHNRIVAHACSRLPPECQPTIQRSWFAAHSLDSADLDLGFDLDDEITAFLSGIDIVVPTDNHHLAFNPLLIGIVDPHGAHGLRTQSWEDSDEHDGLIVLYQNTGYDPAGLVYSLDTQKVSYLQDAFISPYEMKLPWADLDEVLQLYWDCIESGKFVVATESPGFGDDLVTQGWRVEQCTQKEMDQILDVWDKLVDVIAKRLPAGEKHGDEHGDEDEDEPQRKKRRKHQEGLISTEVLDKYPAIPPFVRAFLSRARKPPFKSIAPQLEIPDEAFIHRVGAEMQKRFLTLLSKSHNTKSAKLVSSCFSRGAYQAYDSFPKATRKVGSLDVDLVYRTTAQDYMFTPIAFTHIAVLYCFHSLWVVTATFYKVTVPRSMGRAKTCCINVACAILFYLAMARL
jgi:hypothetical protein